MKKYIGKDITEDGIKRLTARISSEVKLPRNITLKDVQAVYTILANQAFTPKEIAAMTKTVTLKKVRLIIHLMLRYNLITTKYR